MDTSKFLIIVLIVVAIVHIVNRIIELIKYLSNNELKMRTLECQAYMSDQNNKDNPNE